MRHLHQLVKDLHQLVLHEPHLVLVKDLPFPLVHLHYEEGVLKLVVYGVLALFNDDVLESTDGFVAEGFEELLVLLDGFVDQFADDVGE